MKGRRAKEKGKIREGPGLTGLPDVSVRGKVKGYSKSLQFILRGTSVSVSNFMAIHPKLVSTCKTTYVKPSVAPEKMPDDHPSQENASSGNQE